MFIRDQSDRLSRIISQNFSDDQINQIARRTGFVKRARKLNASHFLNTLMFSAANQANRSLPDITSDLNEHFAIDISKEGLHKRFNKQGVAFLKELVKDQLSHHALLFKPDKNFTRHFSGVNIKDSSKFSLPAINSDRYPGYGNFSKTNGLMNLQYEFDLISGNWKVLDLVTIKTNDQLDSKNTIDSICQGELYIRDLGYITPTYLKAVIEKRAYFLNRMPPQAVLHTLRKESIRWKNIKKRFEKTGVQALDMDILLYEQGPVKCRLVIEPVSDTEYRKRLKAAYRSAKRHDVGITYEHKIRCRYNTFITNVNREILPLEKIRKVYHLRWQIELVFKTWKSTFEIHKVKKVKTERMECQLLAKLLWVLLNWRLFQCSNQYVKKHSPKMGVSLIKFFKRCGQFSHSLRFVILRRINLKKWMNQTFLPLIENTRCESPTNKQTHYQILHSLNTFP
ncbi:MAG TPA: IS4 family transposase [Cyclobacteriaceae bacterium]|nr:IS4 family transposase [Cyclobacteriaceae bacterium]HRF35304.1 IS4 family transposase [Cyclobacteriaceae bacterium]